MARLRAALLVIATLGCQDQGPEPLPIPPAGPNFTHSPIPLATIARITPIGYNNKVFPTTHTYWDTCDYFYILQGTRPCHLEQQQIVAPGNGTVRQVQHATDGMVTFEGPPGLIWTFGHVTPAAGLSVGMPVTAGQVIAQMTYEHGFDFGVMNYGTTHDYIVPARYHGGFLHGQHPIEQLPEPLRSDLIGRINSLSDPLGQVSFDVAGTASGGWFIAGSPKTNEPLQVGNEHMLLWLARYVERMETRIVSTGPVWPALPYGHLMAVDDAAPDWESVTPASGTVAVRLWSVGADARPNTAGPAGTLLVQMLDAMTLRVEWFNTHDPVTAFTAAAKTYER